MDMVLNAIQRVDGQLEVAGDTTHVCPKTRLHVIIDKGSTAFCGKYNMDTVADIGMAHGWVLRKLCRPIRDSGDVTANYPGLTSWAKFVLSLRDTSKPEIYYLDFSTTYFHFP